MLVYIFKLTFRILALV